MGQTRLPSVTRKKVIDQKQDKMAIYIDNYRFWDRGRGIFADCGRRYDRFL